MIDCTSSQIHRRKVIISSLAGLSMALVPGKPSDAKPDPQADGPHTRFYRALEDARIAQIRQERVRARELYREALRLLPPGADPAVAAEILEELTLLQRVLQNLNEALARHQEAVNASPQDREPRFWYGWTLSRLGRYEEAAEQFLVILTLPDRSADRTWQRGARLQLSLCDYERGGYRSALARLLDDRASGDPSVLDLALKEVGIGDRSLADETIILTYAALGQWRQVESETRQYIAHFGRMPWAERRILKRAGFDADALYVEHQRGTVVA
jgi:tetratricopeptide (TPR) repeat protein